MNNRCRRVLRWVLALAAIGWALALVGAPYGATHATHREPGFVASAAVYGFSSIICHQRRDRTFLAWGAQLPVCARCTGLYGGAAAGALLAALLADHRRWGRLRTQSIESLRAWRIGLVLAAVPTVVTILLEQTWIAHVSNWARALTSAPLGAVVAWIVTSSLRGREAAAAGAPGVHCADGSDEG